MKKISFIWKVIVLISFFSMCYAQAISQVSAPKLSPDEVIRRFTTKESELFEAWKDYAYQQENKLQVIGPANTISGEYYQLSEFIFSDAGKRIERILRAPQSTLSDAGLTMTQEDRNAFINLQPFALTAEELPNYKVTYVGKEKLDDLNTYAFDITPKAMLDQRELKRMKDQKIEGKYFQGRIWVDDIDLQIVKTSGKVVPEFKQRFPKFETYRENIDGKYWFPTYTYGDDHLEFERGPSVHVRNVVRYKNYRRFSGDVKIKEIFDDVSAEETKDKSTDTTKSENATKDAIAKPTEAGKTTKPAVKETEKKTTTPSNQRPIKKP
ncbi:MAG: hypothetical protein JST84_33265 [Acidobacteria bacterium]|nr:hypothetical protein [Acidobacteriota bacterium]